MKEIHEDSSTPIGFNCCERIKCDSCGTLFTYEQEDCIPKEVISTGRAAVVTCPTCEREFYVPYFCNPFVGNHEGHYGTMPILILLLVLSKTWGELFIK